MKRKILSFIFAAAIITAMGVFTDINVNAAAPVYNAATEKITVSETGMYYTLNYKAERISKAKWYPVYGDLDVSKIIPKQPGKSENQQYKIGFISSADLNLAEKTGEEVTSITLPPRNAAPVKANNYYAKGMLTLDKTAEVRVGIGTWTALSDTNLIDDSKSAEKFPFGAIIEVRTAASGVNAASIKLLKIKIPEQPKAPKIILAKIKNGEDGNDIMGLKGTKKDKMQMIITPKGVKADWSNASIIKITTVDNMTLDELAAVGVFGTDASGEKDIHIRTAATAQKPYSMETIITVTFPSITQAT